MSQLGPLQAEGRWIRDEAGRAVILRGVNLGGDVKLPASVASTLDPDDFADHRQVSFVGRPLPLDEADEHLARLRRWGFNCLRLLTSWEAVEHAGPGEYDTAYLDYYAELCRRAGEHGLWVFVDFHQDAWSRPSGGDGAPVWVFEQVGIDYRRLSETNAAHVMQHRFRREDPRPRQEDHYPMMSWSWNYRYPGNAILWTLFFLGRTFAPEFSIEGRNVQDYLQDHYLGCLRAIGRRVRDLPHVIGFDTLNEPNRGYTGWALSDRRLRNRPGRPALPGPAWSPLDGLAVAAGHTVELPYLELIPWQLRLKQTRTVTMNPGGLSLWTAGRSDPFAVAWERGPDGSPRARREDFFQRAGGRRVDFDRDGLAPFFRRVGETVQGVRPDWLIFGEKDAEETFFDARLPQDLPDGFVNASHWYDLPTLGTKRFLYPLGFDPIAMRPAFGEGGIRGMYRDQLTRLVRASAERNCPTLIGEFGIPYDLADGAAYAAWARGERGEQVWSQHSRCLGLMYDALDSLCLGSTQWCYSLSNRNDLRLGDGWNQEDLSIWSRDQQDDPTDPDSGGRGLDGFVRPYAWRVQGEPLGLCYERRRRRCLLRYRADPTLDAPTEFFLPERCFPQGFILQAPDHDATWNEDTRFLRLRARRAGVLTVRVRAS